MRSDPVTLVSGGDASGTFSTSGVYLDQICCFSLQAIASGTDAAGVMIVEASNDNVQPASGTNSSANVTNWGQLVSAGTVAVAGPGSYFIDVAQSGVRWVRAKFTKSGTSTGLITIKYNGKG